MNIEEILKQSKLSEEEQFGDSIEYSLEKIKNIDCEVVNLNGGYLILSKEEVSIDFALLETSGYDQEGKEFLRLIFHGNGTGDSLRECRHTCWGENGYLFYMPLELIKEAMTELLKHFDNT